MSRPIKTNADWWKHPAGLRDNRQVKVIRARHGIVGYGVFNMLIETLLSSDHFSLLWNDNERLCIASDFGITIEELTAIINTAMDIHLIEYDEEGALYSPMLNDAMSALVAKRNRDKERIANCRRDNHREDVDRRSNNFCALDTSDITAIFDSNEISRELSQRKLTDQE